MLTVAIGAEKGTDQVVDAEAKTRGPQWNRLSFLLQEKHHCFIPGHTVHTHSPWAGTVLTGPLVALVLWPDHLSLFGDGPVVALWGWGVQRCFYPSIQVLSGDEGFYILLLREKGMGATGAGQPAHTACWPLAH